jgi:hypothetical protein
MFGKMIEKGTRFVKRCAAYVAKKAAPVATAIAIGTSAAVTLLPTPAHAAASAAATAGGEQIEGLVEDINVLGAAAIVVVLAIVVWAIVSKFLRKSA